MYDTTITYVRYGTHRTYAVPAGTSETLDMAEALATAHGVTYVALSHDPYLALEWRDGHAVRYHGGAFRTHR